MTGNEEDNNLALASHCISPSLTEEILQEDWLKYKEWRAVKTELGVSPLITAVGRTKMLGITAF